MEDLRREIAELRAVVVRDHNDLWRRLQQQERWSFGCGIATLIWLLGLSAWVVFA